MVKRKRKSKSKNGNAANAGMNGSSARRNFSPDELNRMCLAYLQNDGNMSAAARAFGCSPHTMKGKVQEHNWPKLLKSHKVKAIAAAGKTALEAKAMQVAALDAYIELQAEYLKLPIPKLLVTSQFTEPGFDVKGFSEAVKIRQLLTGGATERLDIYGLAISLSMNYSSTELAEMGSFIRGTIAGSGNDAGDSQDALGAGSEAPQESRTNRIKRIIDQSARRN